MLDKETKRKIESCKALQGMTVTDILATQKFRDNLAAYMTEQRETRKAAKASYEALRKLNDARGYKLPAHPIDRVIDLSTTEMIAEYMAVIGMYSKRSSAERQYIKQLGQQAYNLTIIQYVIEEMPELEPVLLPKSN